MEKLKNKYISFFSSLYYPIFIALLVLMGHTFCIELLSIIVVGLSASLGLILCKDLKYVLTPVLTIFFCLSGKNAYNGSGYFFSFYSLLTVSIIAIIFISSLIAHFILYRKKTDFKSPVKSPLFLGLVFLCGSFLLNGLFDKESFSLKNLGFSLVLIFSYIVAFYIFYVGINFDSNFKDYLIYVLFICSCLITLEFYSLFLNGQIKFANGEIIKESIVTGWGIWNTMGCYLSMLLPIHFYLASYVKKYGFIFYGTGLISYLAIVLSLSRSSLLAGTFVMGLSILLCCIRGKNKKINLLITGALAVIGIIGIIALWDKISNILGDYLARGFDDNGRFEIYEFGLQKFLNHPIFGSGFYNSIYVMDIGLPFCYHNTIIQMMASCGIVGLLAYIFHRFQTVKLIIKKRCAENMYFALCICALLITSLLDVHMFSLYPALFYTLLLIAIEKSN